MTDGVTAPIVYIDANPFIYLIEGEEALANHVRTIFALLTERPGIAATSELTLAEVLAKARPDARRSYLNLIVWSKVFQLQPVTRDILIDTAEYRHVSQKTRPDGTIVTVKLPDAIHVVTAGRCRCQIFLSADEGLMIPNEMAILKPNEDGLAKLARVLS
jgi:predicted nucleic acid-binding protein